MGTQRSRLAHVPGVVHAGYWLLRTQLALRWLPLDRACRHLGVGAPGEQTVSRTPDPARVALALQQVRRLSQLRRRVGAAELGCLQQALVTGALLRRYSPTLSISIQLKPFAEAHAWLRVGPLELWRQSDSELQRPRARSS